MLPAAAEVTADYACADGTRIVAAFSAAAGRPGSVALRFPQFDRRMVLPQALSADGGRCAAGGTEFWIKGRQARFTRGDATTMCKAGH